MVKNIQQIWRLRPVNKDIGIEIEMEGTRLPLELGKWWNVTRDGSLRGNGYEYVLSTPCLHKNVPERLQYLQDVFKKQKSVLTPSDRCGVHIHINCQKLTTKQTINFALLYLLFENLLVKWCGEDREGNLFCLRAADAERLMEMLARCRARNSLRDMQNQEFRYAALNISSIRKFGTLEFRAMGTPKKLSKIEPWINMLMRVYKHSQIYTEPQNIVEDMSMTGGIEYLQRVFGPDAHRLIVPKAEELLMNGVRLIQDVAYTVELPQEQEVAEGALRPDQVAWNPMPMRFRNEEDN